jgi:hypothetical protein
MNFDARTDLSPGKKEAFIAWLIDETASGLRRASGDCDALKAVVFLYLNRAYQARLSADEITDVLGVGSTSAMSRAALTKEDDEVVLQAFETLDPLVEAIHTQSPSSIERTTN